MKSQLLISNLLAGALVLLPAVSSCTDGVLYNHSFDVDQSGWSSADTLCFSFGVADSVARGEYGKLVRNQQYRLTVSVRYADEYEYSTIPVHLNIDGHRQFLIKPKPQRPRSWGGMMQEDFDIRNCPMSFADTGRHEIKIYPDTLLTGICSFGIDIR